MNVMLFGPPECYLTLFLRPEDQELLALLAEADGTAKYVCIMRLVRRELEQRNIAFRVGRDA